MSLLAFSGCTGCSTLRYLAQAGRGQMEMFNKARPILDVLKDERTPGKLKRLLAEVAKIKAYGEMKGLKATPNYEHYVALDRAAASWVVSACRPLKFEHKEWSFPIVGSFPYIGWFDIKAAREQVAELAKEGWDVDLRGASAYSTLGWFRDPILSSMISEGQDAFGDLVNVILHESVHATLYINGQSFFNESLATFVADQMTRDYLKEASGVDPVELKAYEDAESGSLKREEALHQVYDRLDALYKNASMTDAEKLKQKSEILTQTRKDLGFRREINNAVLIQFKTYHARPKAFAKLYSECGGDLRRYMKLLSRLNAKSFSAPQLEELDSVLDSLSGVCRSVDLNT